MALVGRNIVHLIKYDKFIGSMHWLSCGPPTIFLSSTFLDLKFERRFVINWLRTRHFNVIAMEDMEDRILYWREWSINSARKCDIYLRLFDRRVGSSPIYMSFGKSFSQLEYNEARRSAALELSYRVHRPFPDWQLLVPAPKEHEAYLSTLNVSESAGGSDDARQVERVFRTGTDVCSVTQLEAFLERDVRLDRRMLSIHRAKTWRRTYFDTSEAKERMLFEDEHIDMHGGTELSKISGVLLIVLASLAITGIMHAVSAAMAAVIVFVAASLWGLAMLAWSPTFVCVGTKTIMARGAFGLQRVQALKGTKGLILQRWRLLDRWLDIGALTVQTPNGRVFVPFISNAGSLACAAEKPPRPDLVPVVITEEDRALVRRRLAAFVEELKKDE